MARLRKSGASARRRGRVGAALQDGRSLQIIVPCERLVPTGGLLRFDRISRALARSGHRIALCPRIPGNPCGLDLHAEVVDLRAARLRNWDAVMVPGEGFLAQTMRWLRNFRDEPFGLRVQHILNDSSRLAKCLAVRKHFDPDMLVFNNTAWPDGKVSELGVAESHVLVGAVDAELFPPRRRSPEPGPEFIVVGQARKSPAVLAQAVLGMDRRVRLVLFGAAPDGFEAAFRDEIADGRITLPGVLDREAMSALYETAGAAVHVEEEAGWANMAAEALARKVPLVCTAAGTASFARHEETALLLPAPTAPGIRRALERIRTDPDAARFRADRGREVIERFDWESYSEDLLGILAGSLSRPAMRGTSGQGCAGNSAPRTTPRVLVLTLHSGEREFRDCLASVAAQVGVEVSHLVISGLGNIEAHNVLCETVMERAADYELFVKLDADMVLTRPTALAEVQSRFSEDPELDHLVCKVSDHYTGRAMFGLHAYSPRARWDLSNREVLFAEPSPRIPGHKILASEGLEIFADRAPAPNVDQALYCGYFRALCAVRCGRAETGPDRSLEQCRNLRDLEANFLKTGRPELGLSVLTATLVLDGRLEDRDDEQNRDAVLAQFRHLSELSSREIGLRVSTSRIRRDGRIRCIEAAARRRARLQNSPPRGTGGHANSLRRGEAALPPPHQDSGPGCIH